MNIIILIITGLTLLLGATLSLLFKGKIGKNMNLVYGFATGVMLTSAFMEMIPHSMESLELVSMKYAGLLMFAGLIGGVLLSVAIDRLVPHSHEHEETEECHSYRLGVISIIAISVHNLFEGMGIMIALQSSMSAGLAFAFSVALHNIPLGIAIGAPLLSSKCNRKKSIAMLLMASLFTPIGGILIDVAFSGMMSPLIIGISFAMVAGMMSYIAIDEMLPMGKKEENSHRLVYSIILGMVVMGLFLLLFGHQH